MQEYARVHQIHTSALLFLGDNWYGWLWGGVKSQRWKSHFEQLYPAVAFSGPCYAVLGNHDYELRPHSKADVQLNYAKTRGTRWSMPAKWYSVSIPEAEPLVRILALDSNYPLDHRFYDTPTLTEFEVKQELDWLRSELSKETRAPFTIVMAHHPIFSNGDHGDTHALNRDWRPHLQEHLVHLYLSGHDHDLQHLEFVGDRTSYVISGGGGAHASGRLQTKQDRRGRSLIPLRPKRLHSLISPNPRERLRIAGIESRVPQCKVVGQIRRQRGLGRWCESDSSS
jgi:tartrate-resistant acid phosphatase type 5